MHCTAEPVPTVPLADCCDPLHAAPLVDSRASPAPSPSALAALLAGSAKLTWLQAYLLCILSSPPRPNANSYTSPRLAAPRRSAIRCDRILSHHRTASRSLLVVVVWRPGFDPRRPSFSTAPDLWLFTLFPCRLGLFFALSASSCPVLPPSSTSSIRTPPPSLSLRPFAHGRGNRDLSAVDSSFPASVSPRLIRSKAVIHFDSRLPLPASFASPSPSSWHRVVSQLSHPASICLTPPSTILRFLGSHSTSPRTHAECPTPLSSFQTANLARNLSSLLFRANDPSQRQTSTPRPYRSPTKSPAPPLRQPRPPPPPPSKRGRDSRAPAVVPLLPPTTPLYPSTPSPSRLTTPPCPLPRPQTLEPHIPSAPTALSAPSTPPPPGPPTATPTRPPTPVPTPSRAGRTHPHSTRVRPRPLWCPSQPAHPPTSPTPPPGCSISMSPSGRSTLRPPPSSSSTTIAGSA